MAEIVSRRTYTSKTFDNGNGTFTTRITPGLLHDKAGDGSFLDRTLEYTDQTTHWKVTTSADPSFVLYVTKSFLGHPGFNDNVIRLDNKFEGLNHTIYLKPHSLWWVNRNDVNDRVKFADAQNVTGVPGGDKLEVYYADAFGPGLDFYVRLDRHGFKKVLVVKNAAALPTPPAQKYEAVIVFRYQGTGISRIKAENGADWDGTSYYESTERIKFCESWTEAIGTFIQRAFIWDSSIRPKEQSIRIFLEQRSAALWQCKHIPKSFFSTATYPIYIDTTYNVYNDNGEGRLAADATLATWDAARDRTTADVVSNTQIRASAEHWTSPTNWVVTRGFVPFDTSAIPDTDVISAATFTIYANSTDAHGNGDADSGFGIVITTQADCSSLAAADMDNIIGLTSTMKEAHPSANRKLISALTLDANNTWTLTDIDSDGFGYISKTACTKLAICSVKDIIDNGSNLGNDEYDYVTFQDSGGANPPTLNVTHAAAGDLHQFAPKPTAASTTSAAVMPVLRPMSSTPTGATATAAVVSRILRPLSSSPTSATITGAATLKALCSLLFGATAASQTGAASMPVLRPVSLGAVGASDTSAIELLTAAIVTFSASMAAISATPDTVSMPVLRSLGLAPTAASTTTTPSAPILRPLSVGTTGASDTAQINLDIVTAGLVQFAASVIVQSQTSAPSMPILRALHFSGIAASDTTSAVAAIARKLSASITAASTTGTPGLTKLLNFMASMAASSATTACAIKMLRALTVAASAGALTSDAIARVLRPIAASYPAETVTSAAALVTAGLGVIVSPEILSVTMRRILEAASPEYELESTTTRRTIH